MVIGRIGDCAAAYNANLVRKAERQAQEMRKERIEPKFFAVGRKALGTFQAQHGAADREAR